jgi:hypothetical protein
MVKNLTTNTTVSFSIFVLTHNHGPGIATLAEWKVGLGNLLPDGNYQTRLPAGSVCDVNGNLLAADFVLNFGLFERILAPLNLNRIPSAVHSVGYDYEI